ncbi:hypothetical protein KCV01_g18645, partial [Aureobasidium melanogenum]
MKTAMIAASVLLSLVNPAKAEDIWFALDAKGYPIPPDTTHYDAAADACHKAYDDDVASLEGNSAVDKILPYKRPVLDEAWATYPSYTCTNSWKSKGGSTFDFKHLIYLVGDTCPDGKMLDILGGQCVSPDEFLPQRQEGDPNNEPNNDPNDCQGNPINAAIGNKFQDEVDYVDAAGELAFHRLYNGLSGTWSHSYSAHLVTVAGSVTLVFDDGRASLFALSTDGIATAEPSERGSLERDTNRQWVYRSPTREVMRFDPSGRLIARVDAQGLTQTLTYGYDNSFNKLATVTDARGHQLTFTKNFSNRLLGMAAGSVAVTFGYTTDGRLISRTRRLQDTTLVRSYLYEMDTYPRLLTGVIDERGIRAATWAYDSQGRAISSEHAGGADKTVITYVDDHTTTVTNPLGHVVTYTYATVGGTRRMTAVVGEPTVGCPIANSHYTYDARGQIATQTDALGHVTAFIYDTQGRIVNQVEAQGTPEQRTTTTTWDGTSFRPKTVTTADRVTSYTYDAQGRPLSTTTRSLKD